MPTKESHTGIERDYSVLQDQKPYVIDVSSVPSLSIGVQARHPIVTHEKILSVVTASPGDFINWHTHQSTNHQMIVPVEGRARYTYVDNDGEEQSFEAGPGEAVFLPGGLENKKEILSGDPFKEVVVLPNLFHQRLEQFLGVEADTRSGGGIGYDKEEDMYETFGLWYDHVRDEVVHLNEDAQVY